MIFSSMGQKISFTPSLPLLFSEKVQIKSHYADAQIPLCQTNFSKMATDVLNAFYRKELPIHAKITVRNLSGQTVFWKDLPFSQKEEILMHHHRGGMTALTLPYEGPDHLEAHIPRWTHGLMHATRVSLIVRMAAQMYRSFGGVNISEKEILLAQYLAIFHDSARQAEGVDVWDDESAENAYFFLIEAGFEKDVALECVQMLKEKDSPSGDKHIITKLIQAGDCIDIMRIYGFYGFRPEFLDMYHDLKKCPGFEEELKAFRKEYCSFINKTEAPLLRAYLEKNSDNYFEEVEALMLMKEKGLSQFPLLSKWYALEGKEISSITKSIFELPQNEQWEDYTLVRKIEEGTHPCYLLIHEDGELFFFKELSDKDSKVEEIASAISKDLTGGLVPKATAKTLGQKEGIIEPYIPLDKGLFNQKIGFKAEDLTFNQKKQLLVHMIADYVIGNFDAHTGQFGIDTKKNVIALDKGEAFHSIRGSSYDYFYDLEPKNLDPSFYWPPLNDDEPTYFFLAKHLKESGLGKILLEEELIKEAFAKSKNLGHSKKYIEMIQSISDKESGPLRYSLKAMNVEKVFRDYFQK